MPLKYTYEINEGTDLSVDNYLLRIATAFGMFSLDKDITQATLEEIKQAVIQDTSYYTNSLAQTNKDIEMAKEYLTGAQLDATLEKFKSDQSCMQGKLSEITQKNELHQEIIQALWDNLPGGKVEEKKKAIFAMQEPNQYERLFGIRFSENTPPVVEAKVLGTIMELMDSCKDKRILVYSQIRYEREKQELREAKDGALATRYDGMIDAVNDWQPVYTNQDNETLEQEVNNFFINHKQFALDQLVEGKEFNCMSEDQKMEENNAFYDRISDLRYSKPEHFINELKYKMAMRIDSLFPKELKDEKPEIE